MLKWYLEFNHLRTFFSFLRLQTILEPEFLYLDPIGILDNQTNVTNIVFRVIPYTWIICEDQHCLYWFLEKEELKAERAIECVNYESNGLCVWVWLTSEFCKSPVNCKLQSKSFNSNFAKATNLCSTLSRSSSYTSKKRSQFLSATDVSSKNNYKSQVMKKPLLKSHEAPITFMSIRIMRQILLKHIISS